jgi:hypothetical protein
MEWIFCECRKAYSSIIPYGCLEFVRQVYVSTLKKFWFLMYLRCSLFVWGYIVEKALEPQNHNLKI